MAKKTVTQVEYTVEKRTRGGAESFTSYIFLAVFIFFATLITTHVMLGVYSL